MRPSLSSVVVAVLTMVLAACSVPGTQTSGRAGPVDGVWRTDGYGWVVAVNGGHAQTFDTTELSCLPNNTADQLGQAAPDGTVQFGNKGVAVETLRRTANGHGLLRLLGTAADIDLLPLPALPDACTKTVPNDPLTVFDVFWATFKENYNSTVRKNIDWNAVRDKYRPMVTASTSPKQLYKILVEMIKPLDDAHAYLEGPDGDSYAGKRAGTRDEDEVSR
jgi:hypothetical protein